MKTQVKILFVSLILLMLIDSKKSNLTRKHGWAISKVLNTELLTVIIEYLKRLKGKLEEEGKADRIATF